MPASAYNARGRRGNTFIRLTSSEETDSMRTRVPLPIGYPKRRRNKGNIYTHIPRYETPVHKHPAPFFGPKVPNVAIPTPVEF